VSSSGRPDGHDEWSRLSGNLLTVYTAQIRMVPVPITHGYRVECRCGWGDHPEEEPTGAGAFAASRLGPSIRRGREHLIAEHDGLDADVVPSSPLLVRCHGCQGPVVIDTARRDPATRCPSCGAAWE
jgi:hypothetical protein